MKLYLKPIFTISIFINIIVFSNSNAQDGLLENSNSLNSFYQAVKTNEAPIHIIYIGDSHTAADFITDSLRKKLQAKWGDAGRGIIQSGSPYAGFRPQGLEVSTPKSWNNKISYPIAKADIGPFGLGGYRTIINNNEKYKISLLNDETFDNISICAKSNSLNDKLEIKIKNNIGAIEFGNHNGQINCKIAKLEEHINGFEIGKTNQNSSPELSSIGVWNSKSGIILSSFGIPGAELRDFDTRSFYALSAEMNIIMPSLVILAFGTNEGFGKEFDGDKYANLLKYQIEKIRKIAPSSSVLIIGAPDANRKTENAGNTDDCKILPPEIINKYPNITYSELGAKYYPPPNLAKVREVQKQVATNMNIAFWDWEKAMGGACSANNLSLLEPREIMGDRVHFSKIGAQNIGNKLADDIINGYLNMGNN